MAEGVITSSDREFREILERRSPEVSAIATAARDVVFELLPDVVEVVWVPQGNAGYGIGPKKMTDQFAWIVPASKHVALYWTGGEPRRAARLTIYILAGEKEVVDRTDASRAILLHRLNGDLDGLGRCARAAAPKVPA